MPSNIQDRLKLARAGRSRPVTVSGENWRLKKWSLDQTLCHAATFAIIAKQIAFNPEKNAIKAFLQSDIDKVVGDSGAKFKSILADTVRWNNFENDSYDDALAFVSEMDPEEIIDLGKEVWNDNARPLAARLGVTLPAGMLESLLSQLSPLATKLPTLSPNFSGADIQTSTSGTSIAAKNSTSIGQPQSASGVGGPETAQQEAELPTMPKVSTFADISDQ